MLETDKNRIIKKENMTKISLDAAQQKELMKTLKCGIYKELHKREFLSDAQLNSLLKQNN